MSKQYVVKHCPCGNPIYNYEIVEGKKVRIGRKNCLECVPYKKIYNMGVKKLHSLSDEEFKEVISECASYREVAIVIGGKETGGKTTKAIRKRMIDLDLSFGKRLNYPTEIPIEKFFVLGVKRPGARNKVIAEKLLPYQCVICGNTGEWNGKPLDLQLDHINGERSDNRLENLRFLCFNCHTQTETYSISKSHRKVKNG